MGLILVGAALLLTWWLARKKGGKLSFLDGAAAGLAIVGAVLAIKGKPMVGGAMVLAAAARLMIGQRLGSKAARQSERRIPPTPEPKWAEAQDVAEARALLGVEAGATPDEIRAAHRRLIALTHPDRGGTPALAARINDARDLLLDKWNG